MLLRPALEDGEPPSSDRTFVNDRQIPFGSQGRNGIVSPLSRGIRVEYCMQYLSAARAVEVVLLIFSLASAAMAQYAARRDGEVVRLEDSAHQIRVSII